MKRKIIAFVIFVSFIVPVSASAIDLGKIIGSAVGGAGMLAAAAKTITPSEEHYIGRAVAAMILNKYPLYNNPALTKYVNKVGLLLAYTSDRPTTYGGYHFAVIKSSEPNAYACPGGFIFVSTALLKELKNEDQLAVILGHEVAHVAGRDGINAIKKSRWTSLGFYAAGEVGKNYSSADVSQLVGAFQSVVTDVAKKVMDAGYSRSDERQADQNGMRYAANAGYNPVEMVNFLKAEEASGAHAGGPFASHPKPAARIKSLNKLLPKMNPGASTESVRTARYKRTTASVR